MTEQKDEIRLKELLSVFGEDRQKEIIEILHRDQIRYHKEQLILSGVSSSAFKDELIRKTESMIWFARENYNKEYYEGVLNAMRNLQVHIKKIYKKHYC